MGTRDTLYLFGPLPVIYYLGITAHNKRPLIGNLRGKADLQIISDRQLLLSLLIYLKCNCFLQTFCTSGFQYDEDVAKNFLRSPSITIAEALGSANNKRCTIEGKVTEVILQVFPRVTRTC